MPFRKIAECPVPFRMATARTVTARTVAACVMTARPMTTGTVPFRLPSFRAIAVGSPVRIETRTPVLEPHIVQQIGNVVDRRHRIVSSFPEGVVYVMTCPGVLVRVTCLYVQKCIFVSLANARKRCGFPALFGESVTLGWVNAYVTDDYSRKER